jgi:hypothetical protein
MTTGILIGSLVTIIMLVLGNTGRPGYVALVILMLCIFLAPLTFLGYFFFVQ